MNVSASESKPAGRTAEPFQIQIVVLNRFRRLMKSSASELGLSYR